MITNMNNANACKTSNGAIAVPVDQLLNDIIWPAVRYCIGRSSYVSTYAQDYWKLISQNFNKFDRKRLVFFARDIRAEISEHIKFCQNTHVDNAYNSTIVKDAYSLMMEYLHQHPEVRYKKVFFEIDCVDCTVTEKPWEVPDEYKFSGFEYSVDLPAWITLANCLDSQKEATIKDNEGSEQTFICVEQPTRDGLSYVLVDNWSIHLDSDYIVSVKPYNIPYSLRDLCDDDDMRRRVLSSLKHGETITVVKLDSSKVTVLYGELVDLIKEAMDEYIDELCTDCEMANFCCKKCDEVKNIEFKIKTII